MTEELQSWEKPAPERVRDLELTLMMLIEARLYKLRNRKDQEYRERALLAWGAATMCFPMTDEERKEIMGI